MLAVRLYQEAIRRMENPVGSYSMILAIYLNELSQGSDESLNQFKVKYENLLREFEVIFYSNKQVQEFH